MAKILGKTHKPKILGADTHSVSLTFNGYCSQMIPICTEATHQIHRLTDFTAEKSGVEIVAYRR